MGDFAIDNQDRIVLSNRDSVQRLNSDGSPDLSLDENGFQDLGFNGISSISIDDSGRLIVTGSAPNVFGSDPGSVVERFVFS